MCNNASKLKNTHSFYLNFYYKRSDERHILGYTMYNKTSRFLSGKAFWFTIKYCVSLRSPCKSNLFNNLEPALDKVGDIFWFVQILVLSLDHIGTLIQSVSYVLSHKDLSMLTSSPIMYTEFWILRSWMTGMIEASMTQGFLTPWTCSLELTTPGLTLLDRRPVLQGSNLIWLVLY